MHSPDQKANIVGIRFALAVLKTGVETTGLVECGVVKKWIDKLIRSIIRKQNEQHYKSNSPDQSANIVETQFALRVSRTAVETTGKECGGATDKLRKTFGQFFKNKMNSTTK